MIGVGEQTYEKKLADELILKATHYASAFRNAAVICRNRASGLPAAEHLFAQTFAKTLEEKARLEEELVQQLKENPIKTLREEGLI